MAMKPTADSYEITPRIVPADSEQEIRIRPLFPHAEFPPDYRWEAMAVSREEVVDRTGFNTVGTRPPVRLEGKDLVFRYFFRGQQEHRFVVRGGKGEHTIVRDDANVMSLAPDLYARRPFKGDLHLHTNRSDGRCSPAYVAARGREVGLDFLAITDHHTTLGAEESIAAFAGAPIDLRLYVGEEVHPPANWIHMVNFGCPDSVNARIGRDEAAYHAAVAKIAATLTGLEPVAARQYASCRWVYDRIREGGGLGILCHPYWNFWHAYNVSEPELERHFSEWPCDALELLGGFGPKEIEANYLMLARYMDSLAAGRKSIPVVGATDAHSTDEAGLFGCYYTVVFSPTSNLRDLVASIRAGYSVAVEALPGQTPRIFGPFDLVKLAYFCIRELYPAHDELCREEGRLMRQHAAGDASASAALAALSGRTDALRNRWWGR